MVNVNRNERAFSLKEIWNLMRSKLCAVHLFFIRFHLLNDISKLKHHLFIGVGLGHIDMKRYSHSRSGIETMIDHILISYRLSIQIENVRPKILF